MKCFLSFRGEDIGKSFTDHLYDRLRWRGIKVFRDDPDLERGTSISSELLTAIKDSMFAIVVLSSNYASSTWCLDELTDIIQVMEDMDTVLPVLYHVDSSDVRKQAGTFALALSKHKKDFNKDRAKVHRWRAALEKLGNPAGWTSKDRYETELIKDTVEVVWKKVRPTILIAY